MSADVGVLVQTKRPIGGRLSELRRGHAFLLVCYALEPMANAVGAPQRSTPANGRPREQSWARLFGYDIFISFALGAPPSGARAYASDLARRLRERGFTVFFSEDEAPAGGELDDTLKRAIRASRVLVLVANRGTLREPRWVRAEVEEFRCQHPRRAVVPISIDGALGDAELCAATQAWLPFADRIWIDEAREAGESGSVSEEVIDRLVTAPRAVRSATRLRAVVARTNSSASGTPPRAASSRN
jgi:hypothetical protein